MKRLDQLNDHFSGDGRTFVSKEKLECEGSISYPEIVDNAVDRELKVFFFNLSGWGYKDSGFEYD